MATETTNYKFKKPDNTDFYNIADQNGNWDKCDKQLKALDDGKAATTHEHTKAEITDFPTKLPADGGNADTVGNWEPTKFLKDIGAVNSTTWNIDTFNDYSYVGYLYLGVQGTFPTSEGYWYFQHFKTENNLYRYQRAKAPMANKEYERLMLNGAWQPWRDLSDATTLGGLAKDNFVQYVGTRLFVKRQSGVKEGGEILFQRSDDSALTADPYLDLFDDKFRFICQDATGTKVINMPIIEPKAAESTVAVFTSGTADKTPGVSNIGKNQIYIMYE